MRLTLKELNYRYAAQVLDHPDFQEAKKEIRDILTGVDVPLLDPSKVEDGKGGVKRRKRKPLKGDARDRYFFLPVDQRELNQRFDATFKAKGWDLQPLVVPPEMSEEFPAGLKADFKKGRLQVEIQFGNMARWYTDVFKFQLSYSLGRIEAAILVVPTQHFANLIDENVAYYERVLRELPHARMSLTIPIWVLGVEPDDYGPIKECYSRAAEAWAENLREIKGQDIATIEFDQRIREEPAAELT